MIEHLKASFETLIEQVDWMDSATKAIAKDKAKAMTALVGYPEWIKDNSRIESYYKGVISCSLFKFTLNNEMLGLFVARCL